MSKVARTALCLFAILAGCAVTPPPRPDVTTRSVRVTGPVSDREAARIALLNNAAFLELAEDNGISQAQLLLAKQLPNPTLSVLFPLGPKQLEFASKFPLESLWLRPRKVQVAELDAGRSEKLVTQGGLDLVRDVKLACVGMRQAERELALARESADLLDEIAGLAEARFRAGDVSELEVQGARVEALSARSEVVGLPRRVDTAREHLRHLLGQSLESGTLTLMPAPALPRSIPGERALLERALTTRPDLRAAEIAIQAAGERVRLAETEVVALTGILDANAADGHFEIGPGLDVTLPVFNRNEGGTALAAAQLKKAARHYVTVRDAVAAEVRQARLGFLRTREVLDSLDREVLPTLETSTEQARRAYESGGVSYLAVLEASRRLHAARVRRATAHADCHRSVAELDRSIGSSIALLP